MAGRACLRRSTAAERGGAHRDSPAEAGAAGQCRAAATTSRGGRAHARTQRPWRAAAQPGGHGRPRGWQAGGNTCVTRRGERGARPVACAERGKGAADTRGGQGRPGACAPVHGGRDNGVGKGGATATYSRGGKGEWRQSSPGSSKPRSGRPGRSEASEFARRAWHPGVEDDGDLACAKRLGSIPFAGWRRRGRRTYPTWRRAPWWPVGTRATAAQPRARTAPVKKKSGRGKGTRLDRKSVV